MTNLVDVGMRHPNIFWLANAMNHEECCEEVSPQ